MSRALRSSLCLGLAAALAAPLALAQDPDDLPAAFTHRDFGRAWAGLGNPWYVASVVVVLAVAAGLGALLGYHPQVRRKAWSFEQLDQPKTCILYALAGALAAMVGREDRSMAYVIFGIGGLMRFRTDVGEAKDTGRVILATLVGVLVGLQAMPAALLATGFSWVLLFFLERQRVEQVVVQGIDREHVAAASEAYRAALSAFGCRFVYERKNVLKGTIHITFRAPEGFAHEALERHFEKCIEKPLRGFIDWEVR